MERQRAAAIDIRLGARIRSLRIQKGLTQKDVAAYLKISHQQVQKYEAGTDKMNLERLSRLRALFGVTWNALLEETSSTAARTTRDHRITLALLAAFVRIPSAATKRRLVDLVKLIAAQEHQ